MPSDQDKPNDQTGQGEPIGDDAGGAPQDPVSSVFEPIAEQAMESALLDEPTIQEPGDTVAEPPAGLPADRPGASATTGTGTSIAVGCTAVCAVILLITILILTIVS